jgi:hypothetical protein
VGSIWSLDSPDPQISEGCRPHWAATCKSLKARAQVLVHLQNAPLDSQFDSAAPSPLQARFLPSSQLQQHHGPRYSTSLLQPRAKIFPFHFHPEHQCCACTRQYAAADQPRCYLRARSAKFARRQGPQVTTSQWKDAVIFASTVRDGIGTLPRWFYSAILLSHR